MLRDLLLNEESENHDLFSESEQSELLFRILKHLSLGGSVNQFEVIWKYPKEHLHSSHVMYDI